MQHCPECGSENVLISSGRNTWRQIMRALGWRYYLCDDCYTRFRARPGQPEKPPRVAPPPVEPETLPPPQPLPVAAPDFSLDPAPEYDLEPVLEAPAPPPPAPELPPAADEPEEEFAPEPTPDWRRAPVQPDLEFSPPELDEEPPPPARSGVLAWLTAGFLAKACAALAVVLGVAALFYWYRLSLTPPPPASHPAATRMKITPEPVTPPTTMAAPVLQAVPTTLAPPSTLLPPPAVSQAPATGLGQTGLPSLPSASSVPSTSLTTTTLAPSPPPPPPPPVVKPPAAAPAVKAPAATRATKPAAKPVAKAAAAKGALALQFGAFSEPARAKAVADKLKRHGYQVHLVQGVNKKGVKLTKVRVGGYANLDQAQKALKAAKAKTGLADVVIVKNGQN